MGFLGLGKKKYKQVDINGRKIPVISENTEVRLTERSIDLIEKIDRGADAEHSGFYADKRTMVMMFLMDKSHDKVKDIAEDTGIDVQEVKTMVRSLIRLGFMEVSE
jgi:DNA-binding MarR family transcriptional regulator